MPRFVPLIFVLVACTQQSTSSGLTLRIAAVGAMEPLGPQLQYSYSMPAKGLVFPPLLEPTAEGEWHARLVTQWARIGANRYRLRLDASAQFSDSSPARNEDLIASLSAFGLRGIERDGWVEVEPTDNEVPIDSLLANAVLFKQTPQGFFGTGPFSVLVQDTSHLQLRRVKPSLGHITEVELLTFATARDAFAHALRGEVNALLMPDSGLIELLHGIPRFHLIGGQGVNGIAAVFNARRLSRDERKALVEALSNEAASPLYETNCELNVPRQPLRPIPPGALLEILVAETYPEVARAGLASRRALGPRGGAVVVQPPMIARKRVSQGLFDILVAPVRMWPPRHAAFIWHTRSPANYFGYSNPSLDEALNAGDYARAVRELQDDPPALLLCRPERTMAVDARIKNPRLGVYDMLESLPDWEVNP